MEQKDIGPMMKKINEEIERKVNGEIKKYHLTLAQARVVLFLSEQSENQVPQKVLEDYLEVSHPTTVNIVKSMCAKKMLETFFDQSDKRVKIVRLIWGNENTYETLKKSAAGIERKLLTGFSDEEKKQFVSLMDRMYHNIVVS
ncbi:MAG: MarR family winged helix-turn-helix transcriptional regulator [Eubacteriaceae bacterium]|nr:MarR family winged helix-turn-helix transcriptional regulator [Eubacteriaceae bacterium]MDD4507654.1 MarR family winged helix-turn-helix transcriptional regulator [Eubacteriaceae bacterium]